MENKPKNKKVKNTQRESDEINTLGKKEWRSFFERHDIEHDLEEAESDLRDAYQAFD